MDEAEVWVTPYGQLVLLTGSLSLFYYRDIKRTLLLCGAECLGPL